MPTLKRIRFRNVTWFLIAGIALAARSAPRADEGYRVPEDPPSSHYVIDARVDLSPTGGIAGTETITLGNTGRLPLSVIALDWSQDPTTEISVKVAGATLAPVNPEQSPKLSSPLFFRLPEPLAPGLRLDLEVSFRQSVEFADDDTDFRRTRWFPRLWWDGLPLHDSFSVALDAPAGFGLVASGRLNPQTGRYENAGARTFGICLGRGMRTESREVGGVLITTLATERGAEAAAACLATAVDVVAFCREWLGFYPFPFLNIVPGGSGRWGGYPFATGIVCIHGQETYKPGEGPAWWQHITSHEIGHQYWGEWVLDADDPDWLWIGLGIFIDTEYMIARDLEPERRARWMGNFLRGLPMYYDLTVDVPPARVRALEYDHNNTVVHSKGPSIIYALDSVLGRPMFDGILKKCLREYGGRRLGWRDFQRFCERESGLDLAWFFDAWVRTNDYLCYTIDPPVTRPADDGYECEVRVHRQGTMRMPVPVKAVFADGTSETRTTDRTLDVNVLTFKSRAGLVEAELDPEKKLAMLRAPLAPISPEAAVALALGWDGSDSPALYRRLADEAFQGGELWHRLGTQLFELGRYPESFDSFERASGLQREGGDKLAALGWMGLIRDLQGARPDALRYYGEALALDPGGPTRRDPLGSPMDRTWLEARLGKPFSLQTEVAIPPQPTAGELIGIVEELHWSREGETPLRVYEHAAGLTIADPDFWFKLGVLLFDGGHDAQAFPAFEQAFERDPSAFGKFAALIWMGHLMDLQGQREQARAYYQQSLAYDTGQTLTHSQFGMKLNRRWVEARLESPFVRPR